VSLSVGPAHYPHTDRQGLAGKNPLAIDTAGRPVAL
jgi:hypothetical protein